MYSSGRRRRRWSGLLFHVAALLATACFVLPGIWVVSASLRSPDLPPPRTIEWFPQPVAWENYVGLWELLSLGRLLGNSLLVVACAVPLTLLVSSWAGFAMAQLPRRFQWMLLMFAVVLRLVPLTTLWLPRFVLFTRLGLIDSLGALLAPALMGSSPFFVLIFFWSFRRLPTALIDSARVDGLGVFGAWSRIAMPLARPATVAVAILSFVQYWSDFLSPLLYLRSEQRYTVPVGLRMLQQLDATNWPLLLAGSVVAMLPVLLVFLAAQHVFVIAEEPRAVPGRAGKP